MEEESIGSGDDWYRVEERKESEMIEILNLCD